MSGVEDMIHEAERSLGVVGRPNSITRWYSGRNGAVFTTAAWCDQSVTYWANRSGNAAAVCFDRDYAFTVWHADRFRTEGQWHVDVSGIRRGDILFFDWDETNRIAAIDHIGLVTGVRDGVVFTIEGNTSDACRRRVRYASTIVGFGRPEYSAQGRPSHALPSHGSAASSDSAPPGVPVLKGGSAGVLVKQLQRCLNTVQHSRLLPDGDFGPLTSGAVKTFQARAGGLTADGEYGPRTAGKLTVARKRAR